MLFRQIICKANRWTRYHRLKLLHDEQSHVEHRTKNYKLKTMQVAQGSHADKILLQSIQGSKQPGVIIIFIATIISQVAQVAQTTV